MYNLQKKPMNKPFKTSTHRPESLKILNDQRQKLLDLLGFTKDLNLYLAGGTGLALYLNHRTSVDFDFYRPQPFNRGNLVKVFLDNLSGLKVEVLRDKDGTFDLTVRKINVSCFYYDYPLIFAVNQIKGINVASLEDIAAMKLIAVVQRGTYRDFVDIFYLLQKFDLPQLLRWTKEKYPAYNENPILKGLLFFNDAEENLKDQKQRIKIFDPSFSWPKAKGFIKDAVLTHQRSFTKG